MTQIVEPFPIFYDDDGFPLEDGMIFVGEANQEPRANPVAVFYDAALSVPAEQPIRTNNGRPAYQGAPTRLYIAEAEYSITVQNKFGTPFINGAGEQVSASGIGFIQAGTGAVARTVQSKLRETVSVKDFGAVGNGSTNDTAAIQAAINSLGSAGGTVVISNDMRCLIDTALDVKPNVSIVGPHHSLGQRDNGNTPYGLIGGTLIVNSAVSITMRGGSSLTGLLLHRKGMTFPAPNASAFAGTAVVAGGDDVTLSECMFLGFALAYSSTGYQRPTIADVKFDCTAGISINTCFDIAYIGRCHGWPFSMIETVALGASIDIVKRTGAAFQFTAGGDWNKVTDCFSYGYFRGFVATGVEHMTFLNCSADNTPPTTNPHANAIGFLVSGASDDVRLVSCQAAAQAQGFYIATTAGKRTRMTGCDTWGTQVNGAVVETGDLSVYGGAMREGDNGVLVLNATSWVFVDQVRFDNLASQPVFASVATNRVIVGNSNDYGNITGPVAGGTSPQAVASATTIALPYNGEVFSITGATTITGASVGWSGRVVTLIFAGVVTVNNGTGSSTSIRLNAAANFTTAAGSTLTLRHNGTQWFEVSRAA